MAYWLWLVVFLILPLALLILAWYQLLWKYRRTLGMCVLGALIVSVPWDIVAVRSHIWAFPPGTNSGFTIAGLPIEEYIFIILLTLLISAFTLVLRQRFYPGKQHA